MNKRAPFFLASALTAATLAVLSASAAAQATTPTAPTADMQAGPAVRPPPPRPGPAPMSAAQLTTMKGKVARWLTNPNGDVDGFLLADGSQVSFAPHLSSDVTAAIKLNDNVQLSGWQEGAVFHATTIGGAASGRTVRDDGPPATPPTPRDPGALTAMSATGRVEALLHGPRGEVNGVVLQSGEQVRFPPHVAQQFPALLQRGATLSARGYGTKSAYGTAFEASAMGETMASVQDVFMPPRPPAGDAPPVAPNGVPPRPAS